MLQSGQNLFIFFPLPGNFQKTEIQSDGLVNPVEEISRTVNIQGMTWQVLLAVFDQIHSEKLEPEPEEKRIKINMECIKLSTKEIRFLERLATFKLNRDMKKYMQDGHMGNHKTHPLNDSRCKKHMIFIGEDGPWYTYLRINSQILGSSRFILLHVMTQALQRHCSYGPRAPDNCLRWQTALEAICMVLVLVACRIHEW